MNWLFLNNIGKVKIRFEWTKNKFILLNILLAPSTHLNLLLSSLLGNNFTLTKIARISMVFTQISNPVYAWYKHVCNCTCVHEWRREVYVRCLPIPLSTLVFLHVFVLSVHYACVLEGALMSMSACVCMLVRCPEVMLGFFFDYSLFCVLRQDLLL